MTTIILKATGIQIGDLATLVFDPQAIKDQEVIDKNKLLEQIKTLNLPAKQKYVLELSSEVLFQNVVDWSSLPIAPSNIQKISDTTATNRELYLAVKFALGQIGWQVVRVYPEGNPEFILLP